MGLDKMYGDVFNDGKIDGNEVKRLADSLKNPKDYDTLREFLKGEPGFMEKIKKGFENSFMRYEQGTSNLSVDDMVIVRKCYENIFGKPYESELNFSIDNSPSLGETMDIIKLGKYMGVVSDNVMRSKIVKQPIVFNDNAMRVLLNTQNIVSSGKSNLTSLSDPNSILGQLDQQEFNDYKDLQEFLKTPKGKQIWEDSLKHFDYLTLKGKLSWDTKRVGDTGLKETAIDRNVPKLTAKYQNYIDSLEKLDVELNSKIKALKESHGKGKNNIPHLKQEYLNKIKNLTKGFVNDLGNTMIDIGHPAVKKGENFVLSVGNLNLRLDFGKVKFSNTENKEQTKAEYKQGFDDIYRDSIGEKFTDAFTDALNNAREKPYETAIEGGAIIFAGLTTASMVPLTEGYGVIKAGMTYSLVHNAFRSAGYGLLYMARGQNGADGMGYGLGYSPDMSTTQYLGKKTLEYGGNIALFGIFKGTTIGMGAMGMNAFEQGLPNTVKGMATKGVIGGGKIGIEASMFTGFQLLSGTVEKTILDNGDKDVFERMGQHFDELNTRDNLINSLVYNLMFVSAVKGSGKIVGGGFENPIQRSDRAKGLNDKLMALNEQLTIEIQKLDQMGYKIVNMSHDGKRYNFGIVTKDGRLIPPYNNEFNGLRNVLFQMNKTGKELFDLRYMVPSQQQNMERGHGETKGSRKAEKAGEKGGEKKGETKGDELKNENHNSGNGGSASEINILLRTDLSKINVERLLKGFDVSKLSPEGITTNFSKLLGKFEGLKDPTVIKQEVGKAVDVEIDGVINYLTESFKAGKIPASSEKTMENLIKALNERRQGLKEEFIQVLEARVKGERVEKKFADDTYWLTKTMDVFVNNMDKKLKLDIRTGRRKFDFNPQTQYN